MAGCQISHHQGPMTHGTVGDKSRGDIDSAIGSSREHVTTRLNYAVRLGWQLWNNEHFHFQRLAVLNPTLSDHKCHNSL